MTKEEYIKLIGSYQKHIRHYDSKVVRDESQIKKAYCDGVK